MTSDALCDFHPAVRNWFQRSFSAPTPAQVQAWPAIRAGRDTLVAAPTGSGKTLTAFMAAIDALVRAALEQPGGLPDTTQVVYVSPLKALSNDIQRNLEAPLAGIRNELVALGVPEVVLRTAVRTGDTPARDRQQLVRKPPHILVTTPESLYILLGSVSGRKMLAHVRTVIVDEIHALAAGKRGSHLALSLERMHALCREQRPDAGDCPQPSLTAGPPRGCKEAWGGPALPRPFTRIGLSATQKPIEEVARFLVGAGAVNAEGQADCAIVNIGYTRQRDLALELPPQPLGAVMSHEQRDQVYQRVAELAAQHRTTLVFVNTRRMAERAARHLGEILGKDVVAAHHGSLSKETRLDAEQRLKRGELTLLVATASLELGLDIGDVDLVCQLASPRSIASFLQRAGRANHAVSGTPKARLFPESRDELVECAALLDCVRRGELDALHIPPAPLDVLAQQIVAEVASREWDEDELFALVRRAWPYAALERAQYDAVLRMLVEGFATRNGPRAGYVHHDAVNRRLRERRGSRLTALTSGGTIPENGDYTVMLEPQAIQVGTVNEDFAIESLAGDIFQLGNTSYRILRIEPGRMRVEDAQGVPPNIPFWLGEAPGRSAELSLGVSRLREQVARGITQDGPAAAIDMLIGDIGLPEEAARQIVEHLARAIGSLGLVPTQRQIVLERFFDESGGMQLVIHTPYGSRINRAWGLALRKRFCRTFNFELQAAATEDAIVLSLSTSHSFDLAEVGRYLHSATAEQVLVQALLDAPLFGARWRWNATNALALPRFVGGRKVAPQLQRMKAEDLLASVFPDQVACAENLSGEREIPDHPLVAQTLYDCLHEAMDVDGWLALLRRLEAGEVRIEARDLPVPSALAAEVLHARPYAFLDDAPLEERRTQAVQSRRYGEPQGADDLGRLDAEAIANVRAEAWPRPRSADEMHEALCELGVMTEDEARRGEGWAAWLDSLVQARRATQLRLDDGSASFWCAAERLPLALAVYPGAALHPAISAPATGADAAPADRDEAVRELLRCRLGALGPVSAAALAASLRLSIGDIETGLRALQAAGNVLAGWFSVPRGAPEEWCERHLLARIHRYTLGRLRREIEPLEPRDFMRFLFDWQHVSEATRVRGPEALAGALAQFEGYEAPAVLWEAELLPARVADYSSAWLDDLCTAGRVLWTRLRAPSSETRSANSGTSLRATPILLLPRRNAALWTRLAPLLAEDAGLGHRARRVAEFLGAHGASFFDEILEGTRLLRTEAEEALAELVARGRARCDSYAGLRALLVPAAKRATAHSRRRRHVALFGIEDAGRWSLPPRHVPPDAANPASTEALEQVARILLRRYGVVCWALMEREPAWLPPWRELVRVYRRLEARGEIRGGRFIAGSTGEQFALPEALGLMREVRRRAHDGRLVCLAASDPANLLGTIVTGPKVARVPGSKVLYQDGVPVATSAAGEISYLVPLDTAGLREASRALTLDSGLRDLLDPAATQPTTESTIKASGTF